MPRSQYASCKYECDCGKEYRFICKPGMTFKCPDCNKRYDPDKTERPPIECKFLKEKRCEYITLLTGKDSLETNKNICGACLGSDKPMELNEANISLLSPSTPEGKKQQIVQALTEGFTGDTGTRLENIFRKLGFRKAKGCGCSGVKSLLNSWSDAEIRKNKESVIKYISQEAKKRGVPLPDTTVRLVLKALLP